MRNSLLSVQDLQSLSPVTNFEVTIRLYHQLHPEAFTPVPNLLSNVKLIKALFRGYFESQHREEYFCHVENLLEEPLENLKYDFRKLLQHKRFNNRVLRQELWYSYYTFCKEINRYTTFDYSVSEVGEFEYYDICQNEFELSIKYQLEENEMVNNAFLKINEDEIRKMEKEQELMKSFPGDDDIPF